MSARTELHNTPVPLFEVSGLDGRSEGMRADIADLVGASKRVLDLNPTAGMSPVLADRGCEVTAIGSDATMAERLSESCGRVIVGDVERLAVEGELGEDRYDVIVAVGLVDRMEDPLGTFRYLRRALRRDGHFVISVPAAVGAGVRLALLFGERGGQPWGLGESKYLRFFTGRSLETLLDNAELATVDLRRFPLELDASNVTLDEAATASGTLRELEGEADAYTYYQYVVKAEPMHGAELEEVQRVLEEEASARVHQGETARRLVETVQGLAETEGKMEQYKAATEVLYGEIEDLRAANLRLQVRLDRILASPPLRLYSAIRELPGMQAIGRRRAAAFESTLEKRAGGSTIDADADQA